MKSSAHVDEGRCSPSASARPLVRVPASIPQEHVPRNASNRHLQTKKGPHVSANRAASRHRRYACGANAARVHRRPYGSPWRATGIGGAVILGGIIRCLGALGSSAACEMWGRFGEVRVEATSRLVAQRRAAFVNRRPGMIERKLSLCVGRPFRLWGFDYVEHRTWLTPAAVVFEIRNLPICSVHGEMQ